MSPDVVPYLGNPNEDFRYGVGSASYNFVWAGAEITRVQLRQI